MITGPHPDESRTLVHALPTTNDGRTRITIHRAANEEEERRILRARGYRPEHITRAWGATEIQFHARWKRFH